DLGALVNRGWLGINELSYLCATGCFKNICRSGYIDIGRLYRVVLTVGNAIFRREMKHDVVFVEQRINICGTNVGFVKLDTARDLFADSVGKIIQTDNAVAFAQQTLGEIRADESGDASYKDAFHLAAVNIKHSPVPYCRSSQT